MFRWVQLLPCLIFAMTATHGFAQEVLLEDRFEGNVKPGWTWVRHNPANCRFGGAGLEIRNEPFPETEAKNVLSRKADFLGKGTIRLETLLSNSAVPVEQYQQSGICWSQNGRIVFKLVHERMDGGLFLFPGKVPIDTDPVALRITLTGDEIVAEYSSPGENSFRRIYEGKLNVTPNDEVSLFCSGGPKEGEHWVRFRYFRITRIDE